MVSIFLMINSMFISDDHNWLLFAGAVFIGINPAMILYFRWKDSHNS